MSTSPPPPPPGVPANPDPWLPARPVPVVRPAAAVRVVRLGSGGTPQALDNVACAWVERHMGTDPGMAAFRYRFTGSDPDAPQSVEQALDTGTTTASLPKLVEPGDRIGVVADHADGTPEYLFDGIALDFGGTLRGDEERADFLAVGLARSAWGTPVGGMYLRDASQPTADVGADTDLVAQFNPRVRGKAQGNATPDGADHRDGVWSYPVFYDPLTAGGVAQPPRAWTLPMAAKYLIFKHNPAEQDVHNPDPGGLDALLVAREPIDGVPFDPSDPNTYTAKDIQAPSRPITGRDWPTALHELVRDKGFGMRFRLDTVGGLPLTTLELFVLQAGDVKNVYLQARGSSLDPSYSNLGQAAIRRDLRQVVNAWAVEGAPVRYEASFILWPMFPMASADGATPAAIRAFDKADPSFRTTNTDSYRLYGVDETGDGHYAPGTGVDLTDLPDLTDLFGGGANPADGQSGYAVRRRVPRGQLVTVDQHGVPFRARLDYAYDYPISKGPGLWDGVTGTWKPISGGWKLRDDRLGISVTADNPNHWYAGKDPDTGQDVVLKGVEAQCQAQAMTSANPLTPPNPNFVLRLTCVVEGDEIVRGDAPRRDASPLDETITRTVDARDRYFKEVVAANSLNNATGQAVVQRDDSDLAKAEAIANRTATECGILDGQVTIPYVTNYYQVGDRIARVYGRGLGFRTDGMGASDTPVYPVVEGVRWDLDGQQATTLFLSDEAMQRHSLERKIRR